MQGRRPRRRDRRARAVGPCSAPGRHRGRPDGVGAGAATRPSTTPAVSTTSARSPSAGSSTAWCCSTTSGDVVRDALLWNDTRSADAADRPRRTSSAPARGPTRSGSVPVASFTVTKLRWVAAARARRRRRVRTTVCLPHDWLTSRLARPHELTTDRGDASGTGYWSPSTGEYRPDLLERAFGRDARACPRSPAVRRRRGGRHARGVSTPGALLAPGTGDNMAAALGLDAQPGDVVVSLGTSGTAFAVSETPTHDESGRGRRVRRRHRPLPAAGLHAQRGAGARRRRRGCSASTTPASTRSRCRPRPARAASCCCPTSPASARRTVPHATGQLGGLTLANGTPANLARAAVEGMLCGLADAVDALEAQGVPIGRVLLIGGAAQSAAVAADRPARCSGARCSWPTRASTSPTAPRARPPAPWVGQESLGRRCPAAGSRPTPTPHVREAYAALRDAAYP